MRSSAVVALVALLSQSGSTTGFGCSDRRAFFRTAAAAGVGASSVLVPLSSPNVALAESGVPSVTVTEFQEIIKDSAKSISIVEFSGPKSEKAVARLIDGTTFEITGLIDSPSDPRSPLKLAAICRASKIPTKFLNLELAVSASGSKKKKSYANSRVQEAAAKEREKKARMEVDEQQRLAELYKIEEAEAKKIAAVEVTAATTGAQ